MDKLKLTLIIVAIMFLGGCASTKSNMFYEHARLSPNYEHADKYCKKHSPNYNACMDAEFVFSGHIGLITGYDDLPEPEKRQAEIRAFSLMRKHGLHEKWFNGDCSYGEWLEIIKEEW